MNGIFRSAWWGMTRVVDALKSPCGKESAETKPFEIGKARGLMIERQSPLAARFAVLIRRSRHRRMLFHSSATIIALKIALLIPHDQGIDLK